jgi:hypothetical protein
MEKFKKFMRHIKLISMNRRLYWMHLEVHEVDQGEVDLHHDPHVPNVQGQAHGHSGIYGEFRGGMALFPAKG